MLAFMLPSPHPRLQRGRTGLHLFSCCRRLEVSGEREAETHGDTGSLTYWRLRSGLAGEITPILFMAVCCCNVGCKYRSHHSSGRKQDALTLCWQLLTGFAWGFVCFEENSLNRPSTIDWDLSDWFLKHTTYTGWFLCYKKESIRFPVWMKAQPVDRRWRTFAHWMVRLQVRVSPD